MNQRRRRKLSDVPFLRKLVEYKEVITLIIFFLGALVWIHTHFVPKCSFDASRQELTNLLKIRILQAQEGAYETMLRVLEDLRDIVEQPKEKENISQKLTELESKYRTLIKDGHDTTSQLMEETNKAYRECSF
jgi:predicted nuclease with TOPRIM domain